MAKNIQQWTLPALMMVFIAFSVNAHLPCSDAWKDCTKSQCCQTPYFECVERNKDDAKSPDGTKHPAYAQCRDSNHSGAGWAQKSCPCDPNSNGGKPCHDYTDWKTPDKKKVPWTCTVLTGGCRAAFKPCGVGWGWKQEEKDTWFKNPLNVPCCHWGCKCNYTEHNVATCQPPENMYACTKQEQAAGTNKDGGDDVPTSIRDDEDEIDAEDDALLKSLGVADEFEVAKTPQPIVARASKNIWLWTVAGFGSISLVAFAAMMVRKQRDSRLSYAEAPEDAENASDSN